MKRIILFFTILLSVSSWAQLANFTITATKQNDETCPSNGAISWTTSGTIAGSVMTYSVVNVATNAVVVSTSSLSFSGLTAGTYKVVATQTMGAQSNQATSENVVIANQTVPLVYSTSVNSDEICGNDGSFRVNVSSGRAPYTYQLLDSSLNVISSQASNVFSGLAQGTYNLRVIDQCGAGTAQQVVIKKLQSYYNTQLGYSSIIDCNTLSVGLAVSGFMGTTIPYPITFEISYTNPDTGLVETKTTTAVYTGNGNANPVQIPFFHSITSLPLSIKSTDRCGNVRTANLTLDLAFAIRRSFTNSQCTGFVQFSNEYYKIGRNFSVNFTSYPAGFDPNTFENSGPGVTPSTLNYYHYYGSAAQPLPAGNYTVQFTSQCGEVVTQTFTVGAGNPYLATASYASCDTTGTAVYGQLTVNDANLTSLQITSAPAAFTISTALPYNIPSENFIKNGAYTTGFLLKDLPIGNYVFQYTTSCNATPQNINVEVKQTQNTYQVTPVLTCTTVTLNKTGFINLPSVSGGMYGFNHYLQKYDYTTGNWVDYQPLGIDFTYSPGPHTVTNGEYRFITRYAVAEGVTGNTLQTSICEKVITSFTVGAQIIYKDAYAYQCADGTYDIAISASGGTAPLTYSIVSDETSTATVILNNGTNPIFHGIAAGSHYFRVVDACGNFVTRKLELAQLGKPGIRAVPDCAAGTLKLVVDGLDYLSFEWYKTTDPATVLSTTSVLDLGTYTAAEAGTYAVRMFTTQPGYCLNDTQFLTITADALTAANAGTGQTVTINYDGSISSVNLFSYLTGTYDAFGTWTEVTTPNISNLLIGSQWNVFAAQAGTYTFRYFVKSLCGTNTSSADVTIILKKSCYKLPVTTGGTTEDTKLGITTLGRAGAEQQNNNWPMIRKGGWIALESNTKGFVVNRVNFDANNLPIGIPPANFVAGMMVYDLTNHCLKIYNGTVWSCFTTQTCPD